MSDSTFLYSADASGNVVIPSDPSIVSIHQYEVDTNATSVKFETPCYVTTICQQSFCASFLSLDTVTLPESLTSIDDLAFYWCPLLKSINIPDSVVTIGMFAFSRCSSLDASFTFNNTSNCTTIEAYAFYDCDNLPTINIPPSLNSLGVGAFLSCNGLTHITIPNTVINVYNLENMFYECTNLASVTIVNNTNITDIGPYAFRRCTSLSSLYIPTSIVNIDALAFDGCSPGLSIYVGTSTTAEYTLDASSNIIATYNGIIGTRDIPLFITSLNSSSFSSCSGLTSIFIPSTVTSVASGTFSECTGLEYIIVPSTSVTTNWGLPSTAQIWAIDYTATSITNIPSFVTYIPGYAFYYDLVLTSITIPSGITSIGEYAFYGCGALSTVDLSAATFTIIHDYAFNGCTVLSSITIPNTVTHIGEYAFAGCRGLVTVTFNEPCQLTNIGYAQFAECTSLVNITLPSSISSIYDSGFERCLALTNITFNGIVTNMGEKSFKGCFNLLHVDLSHCLHIGDWAFEGCAALGNVTFSPLLAEINYATFSGCNSFTNINIPASVKMMGSYAFHGYTAAYTFEGTVHSIGKYAYSAGSTGTTGSTGSGGGGGGGGDVPCFLKGTRILTSKRGYVLVEELNKTDTLINHNGKEMKMLDVSKFVTSKTKDTHPYLIPKGCRIGSSYICIEDLYLSPRHEILVGNQFISINKLHDLFRQIDTLDTQYYEYYHITTENYFTDVIMSNGIPSESFGMYMCMNMDKQFISGLMKYIMNRGTVSRKLLSKARFMQLLNAFLARPVSRLI